MSRPVQPVQISDTIPPPRRSSRPASSSSSNTARTAAGEAVRHPDQIVEADRSRSKQLHDTRPIAGVGFKIERLVAAQARAMRSVAP